MRGGIDQEREVLGIAHVWERPDERATDERDNGPGRCPRPGRDSCPVKVEDLNSVQLKL